MYVCACVSRYDFGYLLKLLTCTALPADEKKFFELLHTWFPCIYDVKFLMTSVNSLKGGLNKLAADLSVHKQAHPHTHRHATQSRDPTVTH